MDSLELRQIIGQPEGLKLDFKRKLHKIFHSDEDYRKTQRDEFIRDILSLTNGNFGTAEQTGYLIIGVGDELKADGSRDLFNVGYLLSPKQILQRVNSACYPPIPDIHCETVEVDGKKIFVVSIPPSPHLHRTLRELVTPTKYPIGTVFIRRNEEIFPATPEECDVILIEKERVFAPKTIRTKYDNLPRSGVVEFVGREQEIERLDQLFQEQNIVAIVGMGGVGKTELANQYGRRHLLSLGDRPGGVCWIDARNGDVGIQIVSFARSLFNLKPLEDWDLPNQLRYCWQNWPSGDVLIAFDDVTDYKQVKPYLPPESSGFKVLLTTRERLGRGLVYLPLDQLKPEAALKLLEVLIDDPEIFQKQLKSAEQICQWLGYLPLGLELVGSYVYSRRDLSLKAMLSMLEEKRLQHTAVQEPDPTMTAELGVAAAFDLSWERLDRNAKQLGYLLSLFALADIPWSLVQLAYNNLPDWKDEESYLEILKAAREDLLNCHLLQPTGKESYRLHPLIREFLREKREESALANKFKQGFLEAMVGVAKQIPEAPNRQQIQVNTPAMPHLAEVVEDEDLRDLLSDEDLLWPFTGIGRFYEGQGLHSQLESWRRKCLSVTQSRFGSDHPYVANSLNNLAVVCESQGRYSEAESLYLQALTLRKRLLGEDHFDVATSMNNLGDFYRSQGRYSEAKPLLVKALQLRKGLCGENHTAVAESLNNLAHLYHAQDHHREAEPLLVQALEIEKCLMGKNHPSVATKLNNLASIYQFQGRYKEAEPLFLQALEIDKSWYGSEHLEVGIDLNNLGLLYHNQCRYREAEPCLVQALELQKRWRGEDHPDLATTMNCLASLYRELRRYQEAECLLIKALEIDKRSKGEDHPDVVNDLNGLGNVYIEQDRYQEAEILYWQALELSRKAGEYHQNLADSLINLGLLYYEQGRYIQAESLCVDALKICQQLYGSNHPQTVNCREGLAMIRNRLNYTQKSLPKSNQGGNKDGAKKKRKEFWNL